MKTNETKITICGGHNDAYFVRVDGKLIASFIEEEDAKFFCECKYPNTEIE